MRFKALIPALSILGVTAGCAHVGISKDTDPKDLMAAVCEPGQLITEAKGQVWMKASSEEASGQFPSLVLAKEPDELRMEVTNLLGGTEARITVDGLRYEIEIPGKKTETLKGYGTWGGIPLRWAADLFMGRFPCPRDAADVPVESRITEDAELVAEVPASVAGDTEVFTYRFRSWGGRPWPEALTWERKGTFGVTVEFEFNDPEDGTRSPLKWQARSKQGEVRVRWRDRKLTVQDLPSTGNE